MQALASILRQHRGRGIFHTILFSPGGAADLPSAAFFIIPLAEKMVMAAAAGGLAVLSRTAVVTHDFDLDVRRARGRHGPIDRVDTILEIGRPLNQGSGEFRIIGGSGVSEQRRGLARKINSSQHSDDIPIRVTSDHAGTPDFVPATVYKNARRQFIP
jgi:hypothetical protein